MMKNAGARPTLPLIILVCVLQLALGCSSQNQPTAQGDAAQQNQAQQDTQQGAQPGAEQASQQQGQPAATTSGSYAAATQDTSTAPGGPAAYEAANQAKVMDRFKKPEITAATSPEEKTAILEKRVDELKYNEEYILKYLDKTQKRLETEQDPNFRAGYSKGLEQAHSNYETNHKDLEAAQKDLADSKKK